MSPGTTDIVRPEEVLEALRAVKDPDLHRDIVDLGFVKNLAVDGGAVSLDIELTTPACPVKETMKQQAVEVVGAIPGVTGVTVNMTAQVRGSGVPPVEGGMKLVRNPIAIASGKGGVGKSTVATNLALALAASGARVGLMDADVYGPSVPRMMGGAADRPRQGSREGWIRPVERHGIKFMSMGLLTGPDTPVIWRGPMATKLIQQFLGQVDWGELDYLLIDLPPGTGDVQLTLTQSAPLAGAVIVTTPQDVAVGVTHAWSPDVRAGAGADPRDRGEHEPLHLLALRRVDRRVPARRRRRRAAEQFGVPFLGEIPLDAAIARAGDAGKPVVAVEGPDASAPSAKAFQEVAGCLAREISIVNEKTRAVKHRPTEAQVRDGAVELKWSDGAATRHPFRELRLACPCAMCVDEWTGEARLDRSRVPGDVQVVDIRPVGRYALQFSFSDGHATGIYSFDKLRALALP